jgi:predicted dehydrogenase
MKVYKVGLIGYGFIGKVHTYGHLNIPMFYDQGDFKTEITMVCTSRPESAAKAAAALGAKGVTDFREITENPDIDIVDICSPNDAHLEALKSAMKNNKHIYCDKPLVATAAEAAEIEALLPDYKGIAQMTLQNRFFPATLRAKQLIEEGRIGDILEFEGAYLHSGSSDPKAPLKWKLEAGTVADLGSHILDLMNYLVGDFKQVCATTHIAYPQRPSASDPSVMLEVKAEDNMNCIVTLPNGASGIIRASKIATGAEDEIGFTIHGSKGSLKWEPMNLDKLFFYDRSAQGAPIGGVRGWTAIDCGQRYDKPAGFPTPKAAIGWLRGHMHCLYNFLSCVHNNVPAVPGLEQGIKIQRYLEVVKESAAKGEWVNF